MKAIILTEEQFESMREELVTDIAFYKPDNVGNYFNIQELSLDVEQKEMYEEFRQILLDEDLRQGSYCPSLTDDEFESLLEHYDVILDSCVYNELDNIYVTSSTLRRGDYYDLLSISWKLQDYKRR